MLLSNFSNSLIFCWCHSGKDLIRPLTKFMLYKTELHLLVCKSFYDLLLVPLVHKIASAEGEFFNSPYGSVLSKVVFSK